MPDHEDSENRLVTSLVPLLSRSLAEKFNVFQVMHHGTHEKQLSNVFAWLLQPDETHELGDTFQKIFMNRINAALPEGLAFPRSGYRVIQEADTSSGAATRQDIADIVLMTTHESVVIENFGTSDGHGHNYGGYLSYGAQGGRRSLVVLLCIRREPERQTDGWEQALVLTYAELLGDLRDQVSTNKAWRQRHPRQNFLMNELIENFTEGPRAVNAADHIAFLTAMCETGESARYGHRPQHAAAEEFAETMAQHAKQQFEDGRKTLSDIKRILRHFASGPLLAQVNAALGQEVVANVQANFAGQWEWNVRLLDSSNNLVAALLFGPTAVAYNNEVPDPLPSPDFSRVFVLTEPRDTDRERRLRPTEVGLDEVLAGLEPTDDRLAQILIPHSRSHRRIES